MSLIGHFFITSLLNYYISIINTFFMISIRSNFALSSKILNFYLFISRMSNIYLGYYIFSKKNSFYFYYWSLSRYNN